MLHGGGGGGRGVTMGGKGEQGGVDGGGRVEMSGIAHDDVMDCDDGQKEQTDRRAGVGG